MKTVTRTGDGVVLAALLWLVVQTLPTAEAVEPGTTAFPGALVEAEWQEEDAVFSRRWKPSVRFSLEHSRAIVSRAERLFERIREGLDPATCRELSVVPGAVEALRHLRQRYRVILVTSRNPVIVEKTQDWLRLNDIPHDHLIFEKEKHRTGQTFEYFIEDHAESALSLADAGIRTFLFDYPWNRSIGEHPNITRVYGWHEVLAELL